MEITQQSSSLSTQSLTENPLPYESHFLQNIPSLYSYKEEEDKSDTVLGFISFLKGISFDFEHAEQSESFLVDENSLVI